MVVDRDDHHDHPLFGELLAVTQYPVADVADRTVDVDVPGGHLAVTLDALGAQRDRIAVLAQQHVGRRDAHAQSEAGMVHQVPVLAVYGHETLGLGHLHEGLQLTRLGMPADVHGLGARVDDLGPAPVQLVDDPPDRPFVARDGVGADDHHVVPADAQPLVVTGGHEGQGRHGLPLGAGGDDTHLAGRDGVDVLDVDLGPLGHVDEAQPGSELHVLAHRSAQGRYLAAVGGGRIDDLLDPVQMAGEAGHHDAFVRLGGEQPAERDADGGFGGGEAGLLRVGGVGEEEADAHGLGQLTHAGEVGPTAVHRLQVQLEVAGVQDHALRGVEGDGAGVGHRVGGGDELDVARPDADPLPVLDGDEVGAVAQAGLLHPVPGQADRELRSVDRDLEVAQQVGQSPGVVLVPVGQDDAVDLVGVVTQVGELGQDQVDARHVGVGKHDAAVEDDDAPVDLDTGAVAPDLPEPAQEDDPDRFRSPFPSPLCLPLLRQAADRYRRAGRPRPGPWRPWHRARGWQPPWAGGTGRP